VRPTAAIIVPPVVQAVWVEFLLGSPVYNAPAAPVVALLYFTSGMLALLVISGGLMINR
jgi:hypothetical protein